MRISRAVLILSVLAGLYLVGFPGDTPTEPNSDYVPGAVLLTFKSERMPEPSSVSISNVRFGIPTIDDLIAECEGHTLIKLVPSYNSRRTQTGRYLERIFVLYYGSDGVPTEVARTFSELSYFESVTPVKKVRPIYFGTRRRIPSDGKFNQQWSLDTLVTGDSIDIDAPEAWAIERGDRDIVIGVIDQGHTLDTFVTHDTTEAGSEKWKLHSDFYYFFNDAEDLYATGEANWWDVDDTDNSVSTDSDTLADNIFGYNFEEPPIKLFTERDIQIWRATPHNGTLDPNDGTEFVGHALHGVQVASIAAARNAGEPNSLVGVAHNCRLYPIRTPQGSGVSGENPVPFWRAVIEAASKCDVINMSWGFADEPNLPFPAIIELVTHPDEDDCVLVASTGNISDLQGDTLVVWPARTTHVLGVGNMAKDISRYHDSEFDPDTIFVDVVAPTDDGVPVMSQKLCWDTEGGPNEWGDCPKEETIRYNFNGTSAASPHVAGIAALVRSRFPELDNVEVRDRIKNSAQWYWGSSLRKKRELGNGKVNAYRALTEWGDIESDTTWDVSDTRDSTFYVSGDRTIKEDVILTINEGVTVKIAPDHEEKGADTTRVQIVVKGTLRVGLDGSEPVIFESFTDSSPTDRDWVGIRFDSTSENNLLDGVTIKNAQIGIQNFAAVTLKNSHIANCIDGIESHATLTADSTVIDSITAYGIEVVAGHAALDSVTISNCSIGIVLSGDSTSMNDSTSVTCTDVSISDLDFNGLSTSTWNHRYASLTATRIEDAVYGVSLLTGSSADIDNCTIVNNNSGVLLLDCEDATIKNAVVDSNSTNGIYCMTGTNDYKITRNYIRENPVGIFCYNSDAVIDSGNTISSNTTGIKCNAGSDAVVEWNTISSNEVGVHALGASDPDLGHETGGSSTGFNTITSNDSFHVVNDTDSITIKAEKNWWGAAAGPDTAKIQGHVDWDPPLTSHPGSPPSPAPPAEGREEGTDEIAKLPSRFDLSPGYPNPFNPVTTMKYQVPIPGGMVQVAVFNVKGQMVKTLLNQNKAPGFYSLTWDGRSDRGDQVASGVYFVMMSAAGFKETKKLVLLK